MNYYKITAAQAATLTKFEYGPNKAFDPFVGEQTDGKYLVSEDMYNLLNTRPTFQLLNWATIPKISEEQLSPKGGE